MEQRITVILGAGAMVESTGVSTSTLTKEIIDSCSKYKLNDSSEISLVDAICNRFLDIYKQEVLPALKNGSRIDKITSIISFEDIYHVLELMPNFINKSGYKDHESSFQIFGKLKEEFEDLKTESDIVNIALHISLKNFEQQCNGINIHAA